MRTEKLSCKEVKEIFKLNFTHCMDGHEAQLRTSCVDNPISHNDALLIKQCFREIVLPNGWGAVVCCGYERMKENK